jgi:hypothetical protein
MDCKNLAKKRKLENNNNKKRKIEINADNDNNIKKTKQYDKRLNIYNFDSIDYDIYNKVNNSENLIYRYIS